jgi:anti-sigma factor RsiW
MMNDCQDIEIREALPELVHGTLPEVERARVHQHLTECGDCSAELAIIRAVRLTAATPSVDVARIVAAVLPYRRKTSRMRNVYLELAAACLIGAVGISTFVVHARSNSGVSAQGAAAQSASIAPGLVIVNTSDLSDDGLAQLTRDLDKLQAMPTADPESVTPAALQDVADPGVRGDSA